MSKPEKNTTPSLSVVIPTLGRGSLAAAKASCGDIPVRVKQDHNHKGAGPTRNLAIRRVTTDWVGFLDDDDELARDYKDRFLQETSEHPDADCIIFRAKYPDGKVLPKVPQVIWGNVPISFAVKTEWAKKHPFVKEQNAFQLNEDYRFLKTIEENGAKIIFSPHVTYLVKPSEESQANTLARTLK